jgi:hypothetical protein
VSADINNATITAPPRTKKKMKLAQSAYNENCNGNNNDGQVRECKYIRPMIKRLLKVMK